MKLSKIEQKLKGALDEKRYTHSLGVSYTACALAMKYGCDIDKARLAGILHDCAKHLSGDRLLELALKYKLPVSEVEKKNPFLLHGKVGALIANRKFDIEDADILNAITYHTTGRPSMSLLEKIIFISDYIEPGRSSQPDLSIVRSLAFNDLDMCLLKILEDSLLYLKSKDMPIDPGTEETYNYYVKECVIK